jgi:hypothetical protein
MGIRYLIPISKARKLLILVPPPILSLDDKKKDKKPPPPSSKVATNDAELSQAIGSNENSTDSETSTSEGGSPGTQTFTVVGSTCKK